MINQYNPMIDIDRRIEDLQRLKNNYQNIPQQQPINIYNNANTSNSSFDARILNENEKVDEILVNNKTMFFDPFKGKLSIKEINGDIKEYDVILPKTQEQLRIEELERKISEYEQYINANNEKQEPRVNDDGDVKSKSKTNVK